MIVNLLVAQKKSQGFISILHLCLPWISVQNVMAIYPIDVEIFQDQSAGQTDIESYH